MNRKALKELVASTFECDASLLHLDTKLTDIENFDSVNILSLMVALDDEAGIKLDHTDLSKLETYADIENIFKLKGQTLED